MTMPQGSWEELIENWPTTLDHYRAMRRQSGRGSASKRNPARKRRTEMKLTHAARLSAAMLLLAPAGALAQSPIFFDDFSGTSLGPHWTGLPNPLHAQYSVGNGRLTVDWIETPPGPPWNSSNNAGFWAHFTPYHGDFVATIRLGWEPGTYRQVRVSLHGQSRLVGEMVYHETLGVIRGHVSGVLVSTPAPGAGIHEFEIAREAEMVHFALNNQHIGSVPATDGLLDSIILNTTFFLPGQQFQPVFFEFVHIVPSPGTLTLGVAFGLLMIPRRRRY
jgi:hypothetical protein